VDDERLARAELKKLLQAFPEVDVIDEAANAHEGVDKIESQNPDIIFLDYNMDDLNGIDVLKQIKKFNPSIIVLFISGQEDIEIAVNTIQHGALDYIVKSSLSTEKMKAIMERIESRMPPENAAPTAPKSLLKRLFS